MIASMSPSSTPLSHRRPLSLQPSLPWSSLSAVSTIGSSPPSPDTSGSSSPPLSPTSSLLAITLPLPPALLPPRTKSRQGLTPPVLAEPPSPPPCPLDPPGPPSSTASRRSPSSPLKMKCCPVFRWRHWRAPWWGRCWWRTWRSTGPQCRRRLWFQRKPNLVQTQVQLLPHSSNVGIFRPETGSLVQPYLGPMVAGLSLITPSIGERVRSGSMPHALCVGVGGGALLMCLRSKLGFDVLGVEADGVVLDVARRHFGLVEDEFLRVCVGDGIRLIESFARERMMACRGLKDRQVLDHIGGAVIEKLGDPSSSSFDAIMVDLDSRDAMSGIGLMRCDRLVSSREASGFRCSGAENWNIWLLQARLSEQYIINRSSQVGFGKQIIYLVNRLNGLGRVG